MSISVHPLRLVAVLAVVSLAACGGSGITSTRSTSAPAGSTARATDTQTPGRSTSSAPAASCVDQLVASMTPAQRAGQLVMVGLDASAQASSLDALIADSHIGNIFFIGGWSGAPKVTAASAHVQHQVSPASTAGVKFLIAADQEGGQVQQLRGEGFTRLPSALQQGAMTPAARTQVARTIGGELKSVGVNVDFAPVADTVPPGDPRSNDPIGRWGRQYGNDPTTAAAGVVDAVRGMQGAGTLATLKHFPGLGRITGNTDFTADGIVDPTTSATDDYLKPFERGIGAGAKLVMVSSAFYTKIDPDNQAIFSPKVIDGVLRDQLKFDGIVISDDLNAVAVRGIPAGERAVRMIRAGGDIALTGLASQAPVMARAIASEAASDPSFEVRVKASVNRVLTVKSAASLTPCKPG